jgi:hypothetical protein
MEHMNCTACCRETPARPPKSAFLALVAAFWGASVFLGFGAAQWDGWGLLAAALWITFAVSVVNAVRRATSWTCAECGSAVVPPVVDAAHFRHT